MIFVPFSVSTFNNLKCHGRNEEKALNLIGDNKGVEQEFFSTIEVILRVQ